MMWYTRRENKEAQCYREGYEWHRNSDKTKRLIGKGDVIGLER